MEKINIVKEWFDFAEKDIASAKFLLNMRPVPLEIVVTTVSKQRRKR